MTQLTTLARRAKRGYVIAICHFGVLSASYLTQPMPQQPPKRRTVGETLKNAAGKVRAALSDSARADRHDRFEGAVRSALRPTRHDAFDGISHPPKRMAPTRVDTVALKERIGTAERQKQQYANDSGPAANALRIEVNRRLFTKKDTLNAARKKGG